MKSDDMRHSYCFAEYARAVKTPTRGVLLKVALPFVSLKPDAGEVKLCVLLAALDSLALPGGVLSLAFHFRPGMIASAQLACLRTTMPATRKMTTTARILSVVLDMACE